MSPPMICDGLQPHIDEQTMRIHHTQRHQADVDKLNAAIEGRDDLQQFRVVELVRQLDSVPEKIRTAVRNHGGGHVNHSFFWPPLKKGVSVEGDVAEAINSSFGEFQKFREEFSTAATLLFGSETVRPRPLCVPG
jgi:Fe-Mn family superoxide dismutase